MVHGIGLCCCLKNEWRRNRVGSSFNPCVLHGLWSPQVLRGELVHGQSAIHLCRRAGTQRPRLLCSRTLGTGGRAWQPGLHPLRSCLYQILFISSADRSLEVLPITTRNDRFAAGLGPCCLQHGGLVSQQPSESTPLVLGRLGRLVTCV